MLHFSSFQIILTRVTLLPCSMCRHTEIVLSKKRQRKDRDEWAAITNWWPLQKWWHISRFHLSLPTCALLPCFEDHSYKTSSLIWPRPASHYTSCQAIDLPSFCPCTPASLRQRKELLCCIYNTKSVYTIEENMCLQLDWLTKIIFQLVSVLPVFIFPLCAEVRWRNLLL